jgi:hypothetical protein
MKGNGKYLVRGALASGAGMALALASAGVAGSVAGHSTTTTTHKGGSRSSTKPTYPPTTIKSGPLPAIANPCSYVSAGTVGRIVGQRVKAVETTALFQSNQTSCQYQATTTVRGKFPRTVMSVAFYSSAQLAHLGQTPSSYLTVQTKNLHGVTRVSNLGLKAYSFNGGAAYFVMTKKGVVYVTSNGTGSNAQSATKQVTATVTNKVS